MSFTRLLKTRGFLLYWVAQITSRIGDSIHEIALLWLVYDVAGDPTLLGAVVVAQLLPNIAVTLPAGSIVDRWNKKYVMVIAETIRAVSVLAIPLVGQGSPSLLIPVVIGVAALNGLMEGFFEPAREAILPELVSEEQYDSANVLSNLTARLAQLFYIVGGIIIALEGSFVAFYINSGTFIFAAAVYLFMPIGAVKDEDAAAFDAGEMLSDIRNGLSYVSTQRLLLTFIVIESLLGGIVSAMSVILPIHASRLLGGGSELFGLLLGAFAVGLLVGTLCVRALESHVPDYRGRIITSCLAVSGVMLVGVGVAPQAVASNLGSFVPLFAFGIFLGIVTITGNTLLYLVIPEDKRGMVFSVMLTVGQSVGPVFVVAVSLALDVVSTSMVFLVLGAATTGLGVWTLATPLWSFTDPAEDSGAAGA